MRGLLTVVLVGTLLAWGCGGSGDDPATVTATTTAAATGPCAKSARPPAKVPGAPLDTILRVPQSARGQRAALVLALHFAGGTGAQMEAATRYTPKARREGFVVAYPTASQGGFWSIDRDLRKLGQTLDAIERAACIDVTSVYVSGISNGGFMATVMACRDAGIVTAVALFAPGVNGIGTCKPVRPVSVLEVHGTADPIVPYKANDIPGFVAGWARRNGCGRTANARRGPSAKVAIFTWPGCGAGSDVEHLRLTGGKHVELLPQLRAAGVDPAHTAWSFLASHRLQS